MAVAAGGLLRPRPRPVRRRRTPELGDDAVVASDGTRLPVTAWQPEGPARGIVIALHGFGDHRLAFTPAGPLVAAAGLILYAYDQRGFGETKGRGAWPGVDNLVGDLGDVVRAARSRHPDLPVALLGESMGGAVALAAAGADLAVDALVLAAPAVRGDLTDRQLHDFTLRLAALAMPWLAVEVEEGGRPWLLAEERERLAKDPALIRELSAGTYDGLVELANRAIETSRGETRPVLVLQGDLDTTLPPQALATLMARLGARGTLRTYPDRHHLLLHEEGHEEVIGDIVRWLTPILAQASARGSHEGSKAEGEPAPSTGDAASNVTGPDEKPPAKPVASAAE